MSKQKRTPGPWSYGNEAVWADCNGMENSVSVVGLSIRVMKEVCEFCNEPDGRLIASAPELLDACQSMLSYIEMRMAHTGTQTVAEITDSLKRVVPYVAEVSTYHHAGCAVTTRTVDLRAVRNAIAKTEGGGG